MTDKSLSSKKNTRMPLPSWLSSLRTRILIISVVLFGLMIGAVILNSIRVIEGAMIENIRVSAQQTSEILNLAAAPYATSGDFGTLKIFLDELLGSENKQSGLVYLAVGREDGTILLQSGGIDGPIPVPDLPENYSKALNQGIVHIRRPLLLTHNAVGFIQYGLSFKLMVAATHRINRDGIVLAVGGLTVMITVLLAVMLNIVRRTNALVRVSQAITLGNYSLRAPVKSKDEISILATNLNHMADAIRQRINEITRLNQDLETRVEERTKDLVEVNSTLEQTIENLKWTQKSLIRSEKLAGLGALVAGVAHELNTPIGNALTVASTLQDYTRALSEEFRTALRRASLEKFLDEATTAGDLIVRNLQRTADLVTSFKHVAVDQTSENRREFELRTTITEIIATLSPMIKKTPYRLELAIEENIHMNSYPGALGQIITNLITNALFHAFADRDQGSMQLRVTRLKAKEIKLEFSDDGIGMNEDTLRYIFDPFFTTRFGQGGSGLGMSIVHNLVTVLLGGSIEVQSLPEKGTRFTIFLPIQT